MMQEVNLTLYAGSSAALFWPVTPSPAGGSVTAEVRQSPESDVVLMSWSTAAGTATVDANGVTLLIDGDQSEDWTWKAGYFDIVLAAVDGEKYRLVRGTMQVVKGVTRV